MDFNSSEDPEEFARRVGLSTQRIKEIAKETELECQEKENYDPMAVDTKNAYGVVFDAEQVLKETTNSQAEAKERIRKAKAKADSDEAAVVRRSVRNRKNEELHAMDRCEDMARKRNLEDEPEKRAPRYVVAGS